MLTLRNLIASLVVHLLTLFVVLVLPSMKLQSKPKQDVIAVQLVAGIPTGSLTPKLTRPTESAPPEAITKSSKESPAEDDARPIPTEKKAEPKKPVAKKEKKEATPPPAQTAKPKQVKSAAKKKPAPIKELDAAALANAEDSSVTEISAPAGSPFGTVKVDNPDFSPYVWWMTQTFTKIQENMRNTVQTDERLVCELYFQVLRSGKVTEAHIVTSSGDPRFDQDCLDAIERSAPFPPLPAAFKEELIGITLPFLNAN